MRSILIGAAVWLGVWAFFDSPRSGLALGAVTAWFIRREVRMLRNIKAPEPAPLAPVTTMRTQITPAESVALAPNPYDIPALMAAGDWATARLMLQKMAYTMPREPEEVRERFKGLMKKFAVEDPLYARAVAAVRPVVASQPGVKQTDLYGHMPTGSVEEARYVLYFAHELGDLVRVKKGNTYQVYPPGFELPAEPPAPKRRRKSREAGAGVSD